MRTIDYAEWKKTKGERVRKAIAIDNAHPERAIGRRPRDPEKERILIQMTKARIARNIETGKLQILGPRHWKWRIDFGSKTGKEIDR